MSAATDPTDARERLAEDDSVGQELCDLLTNDDKPDAPIQRVLNAHGDWAEAKPSWQDYRKTLDASDRLVCRWERPSIYGETLLVRATDVVGEYERVPVRDGTTVANAATTSGGLIEVLVKMRGQPTLLALEDVYQHFVDGDSA